MEEEKKTIRSFSEGKVLLTYPPQTEIRVYISRPHLRETNG